LKNYIISIIILKRMIQIWERWNMTLNNPTWIFH